MAGGRANYFILHLHERDRTANDACFEIQILDHHGQAIHFGSLNQSTQELTIDNFPIPTAVIEAAKRLPIGKGEYVDQTGNPVPPF